MKGIPFINRAAFAPNKRAFFLNGKSSGMSSMVRRRLAETTKHCASTAQFRVAGTANFSVRDRTMSEIPSQIVAVLLGLESWFQNLADITPIFSSSP